MYISEKLLAITTSGGAGSGTTGTGVDIGTQFGPAKYFGNVSDLINVLLPNILTLAGVIAFIAVIITGFKYMQSAGDAKAQEANQGAFTAAVIGLIIIFGAYFFIQIFENVLGIPLLQLGP